MMHDLTNSSLTFIFPSLLPSVFFSIIIHEYIKCIFMQFGIEIMPVYQTIVRILQFFTDVLSYSTQTPRQALTAPED